MREIHDHKTNTANDNLKILATDTPGVGGANHRYVVSGLDTSNNDSKPDGRTGDTEIVILFQNGPIKEHGVNGLTQEVLLAIVADRLRSFQAGQFATRENAIALTNVESALLFLQKRTHDRMRRGVEGTHQN